VIAYALKLWLEFRPSREMEDQGLDINDHGEEGYIFE
jgi:ammonia channel protein AmtB